MKFLRIKATNFKNCADNFTISFTSQARKTSEDKEYELQLIDDNLYTFNNLALIGKNASGKSTALELINSCYSIFEDFHLENKYIDFDNVHLEIIFYYEKFIYKYKTVLSNSSVNKKAAIFDNQELYKKKYYKTKLKSIFEDSDWIKMSFDSALPKDTSILFNLFGEYKHRAMYYPSEYNSFENLSDLFSLVSTFKLENSLLKKVLKLFDNNIDDLKQLDNQNYELIYSGSKKVLSDKELSYFLSSGTKKGIQLYIMAFIALKNGIDLLVDEIENHFHKTLVENLLSLFKDKLTNKHNSTLMFTTHDCELLDTFNRSDNIWITKSKDKIYIQNMYENYPLRTEILKSKKFYSNHFDTAISYEALMDLKKALM